MEFASFKDVWKAQRQTLAGGRGDFLLTSERQIRVWVVLCPLFFCVGIDRPIHVPRMLPFTVDSVLSVCWTEHQTTFVRMVDPTVIVKDSTHGREHAAWRNAVIRLVSSDRVHSSQCGIPVHSADLFSTLLSH